MSWAKYAKETLKKGLDAAVKPRGSSMKPKIESGDVVTIAPCDPFRLKVDDIVLVTVKGKDYLHLIKAVDSKRFLIGNNRGGINGWVGWNSIHGKAVEVSK